jgi:hypothetical protein
MLAVAALLAVGFRDVGAHKAPEQTQDPVAELAPA